MKIANVLYQLNWSKFRRGYSFFVPCIDSSEAKKDIRAIAKRLKMEILMKVVIEDGIKGLRVWRI